MKIIFPLITATVLLTILAGCYSASIVGTKESIYIKENDQTFEIGVPISKLTMYLPKSNFKRVAHQRIGSGASPRYFLLTDSETGVSLSGWFEHAGRFKGVQKPHPASLDGVPLIYNNISFNKIGAWDSVSYDAVIKSNKIPNLKAHLVRENTWIELHISGSTHALLRDIINSIQVQER